MHMDTTVRMCRGTNANNSRFTGPHTCQTQWQERVVSAAANPKPYTYKYIYI